MILEGGAMLNQLTQTIYKTAIYLRLSREDVDREGESASIENQRKLLLDYAKENGFTVYKEYVDDGFSGTTLDRPQLQQLLKDVENEHINLVIVKDFSRLGREYIGVGNLLENYFPLHNVRFISVNDYHDSQDESNSDLLPFKHIINEMYAKDTSKKIRATFKTKYKNGEYIGNFAPFGYQKDIMNKNHLVIDEESAPIVQRIFKMAADGINPAEIARQLNSEKVMCPSVYRCFKHQHLNIDSMSKLKCWASGTIQKLLKNVVYLGHMAQGKTERLSYKLKVIKPKNQNDWVVVKDTHEPLIDEQTFHIVRQRSQSRRLPPKNAKFRNIFSGLAKCADCGKNMSTVGTRKKDSPYNLACGGYKLHGIKGGCSNHFIDYNVLYTLVMKALQQQVHLTEEEKQEVIASLENTTKTKTGTYSKETNIKKLNEEKKRLVGTMQQVYGDFYEGKFDEDTKNSLIENYTQRLSVVSKKLKTFENMCTEQNGFQEGYKKFMCLVEKYTNIESLDSEVLFTLIDRIEVEQGRSDIIDKKHVKQQTVRIYFKFMADATLVEYSS